MFIAVVTRTLHFIGVTLQAALMGYTSVITIAIITIGITEFLGKEREWSVGIGGGLLVLSALLPVMFGVVLGTQVRL